MHHSACIAVQYITLQCSCVRGVGEVHYSALHCIALKHILCIAVQWCERRGRLQTSLWSRTEADGCEARLQPPHHLHLHLHHHCSCSCCHHHRHHHHCHCHHHHHCHMIIAIILIINIITFGISL